jgi:hypothetical protein
MFSGDPDECIGCYRAIRCEGAITVTEVNRLSPYYRNEDGHSPPSLYLSIRKVRQKPQARVWPALWASDSPAPPSGHDAVDGEQHVACSEVAGSCAVT